MKPSILKNTKCTTMSITMEFVEPLLASSPGNPEVFHEFKAKQALEDGRISPEQVAEEVGTLPDLIEEIDKMSTVFPVDETGLFFYDYIFKGAIKEWAASAKMLGVVIDEMAVPYHYVKAIDQFVLPSPRRVYLLDKDGNNIKKSESWNERSLRAKTMQGERICLARSQELPPGTNLTFDLTWIEPISRVGMKKPVAFLTKEWVSWMFDWGSEHGFAQWRSGGYGRFDWTMKNVGPTV